MLKSRVVIDEIFKQKNRFIAYPLSVSWIEQGKDVPTRMVFSAPKRKFKRAVDRNRLKRFLKESYRTNNNEFLNYLKENNKSLAFYIGYIGKEILPYQTIEDKIKEALIRLTIKIENKDED